jgi:hypothetical protein
MRPFLLCRVIFLMIPQALAADYALPATSGSGTVLVLPFAPPPSE